MLGGRHRGHRSGPLNPSAGGSLQDAQQDHGDEHDDQERQVELDLAQAQGRDDPPDGLWQRLADGTLEVRVPWTLINVTDPSQRRVLDDRPARKTSILGTTLIPGIRAVALVRGADGTTRTFPASGRPTDVAQFTWPTWETPSWSVRQRPVFDEMRNVFARLQPVVMR